VLYRARRDSEGHLRNESNNTECLVLGLVVVNVLF